MVIPNGTQHPTQKLYQNYLLIPNLYLNSGINPCFKHVILHAKQVSLRASNHRFRFDTRVLFLHFLLKLERLLQQIVPLPFWIVPNLHP